MTTRSDNLFDPRTSHSNYSTSGSVSRHGFHSTSQTELARQLQFPGESRPGITPFVLGVGALALFLIGLFGYTHILLGGAWLLLVVWLVGVAGTSGALGCMILIGIASLAIPSFVFDGFGTVMTVVLYVVCPLAGAVLIVSGVQARREFDEVTGPAQERAREIWNRLHYCGRDDAVFDPETGESAPIHDLRSLIRL